MAKIVPALLHYILLYLSILLKFLEELLVHHRILEVISRISTEWTVSFNFRLTSSAASSDYCSIVHLTKGGDGSSAGDRIGSVFLDGRGSKWEKYLFSTGINGIPSTVLIRPPTHGINESAEIEFHQRYLSGGKYRVFVKINGQEICSVVNTNVQQF